MNPDLQKQALDQVWPRGGQWSCLQGMRRGFWEGGAAGGEAGPALSQVQACAPTVSSQPWLRIAVLQSLEKPWSQGPGPSEIPI